MLVDDVIKTIKDKRFEDVEQALEKQFDEQIVVIDRKTDKECDYYCKTDYPVKEVSIGDYSFVLSKLYPYKEYAGDSFFFKDFAVSRCVVYQGEHLFNLYETVDDRYIISRD